MARSILVVSAAVSARRALERTLQRRGYRVSVAGSAHEAAQHDRRIDLAVLDLDLLDRAEAEALVDGVRTRNAAQKVVFLTSGRSRSANPRTLEWAASRGHVIGADRHHELLHIVKMLRDPGGQIVMPSSVAEALRVNQPIQQWPNLADLTARR